VTDGTDGNRHSRLDENDPVIADPKTGCAGLTFQGRHVPGADIGISGELASNRSRIAAGSFRSWRVAAVV
jgi:hypothetical protein